MPLVEGCGIWSDIENSGEAGGRESWKGGGAARLGGFGGGGNEDCGERGGRTNSVVTSSFGCEHEASRSSTLVIRAIVSLDGGGGEGGMSSVSNVCAGAVFLGGELNLTLFLPFLPATAIEDLRFCFAGCGFIGDFDFLREGEASFFFNFNADLVSTDANVPAALGDGGRSSIIFLTSHARRSSRNSNRWTSSAARSLPSFNAASARLRRSSSNSSRSACNHFFSFETASESTSGEVERTRDES